MTQSSEDAPVVVNGTITSVGLPRLLGAIWGFDLRVPEKVELLKTKLRLIMEERGGTTRMPSGSYLYIEVTEAVRTLGDKRYRLFLLQGELEQDDLAAVRDSDIEEHWESYGDDELGPALIPEIRDSQVPHASIHPSSAPPSRSK